jgi:CubicO group peptidase (beta-lactamase class C family)
VRLGQSEMKFPFQLLLLASIICPFLFAPSRISPTTIVYPGKNWEKCTRPETMGWSSKKLSEARAYSREIGSAAVLIVQHGVVIDEWGATDKKFNVHSIRKSFLGALYGIANANRQVRLEDTLETLGIDDVQPKLSHDEKQAQILDLLTARSGVFHAALYETPDRKNKPPRGSHPHGTFWLYNNWDFNALGTIYEHAVNSSLFVQFKKAIADPIGMEDFSVDDTEYISGAESMHCAYLFRMTARDMARFGLLYLRNGRWAGKEIVPGSWVARSTTPQADAGVKGGFGYLWWAAIDGRLFPTVNLKGAYAAWGAGGHYILVIPEIDTVIVHRFNTDIDEDAAGVTDEQFGALVRLILAARQ